MTLPAWAARARPIDDVTLEVGFLIREDFPHGPENRCTPEDRARLREPVRPPALEIYAPPPGRGTGRCVLSRAAAEAPEELARYYADLLRLGAKHGKRVSPRDFTLYPILFSADGFEVRFDSGSNWDDALLALERIGEPRDGRLYDVREDGWETDVIGHGDRLYVRAALTDEDGRTEEWGCASFPRDLVVRQIAPLRERTGRVLEALRRELGEDHWSRRWVYTALGIRIGPRPARDAAPEPAPPRPVPAAEPRPVRRPKWKNRQGGR
jgi:hypothetical protein